MRGGGGQFGHLFTDSSAVVKQARRERLRSLFLGSAKRSGRRAFNVLNRLQATEYQMPQKQRDARIGSSARRNFFIRKCCRCALPFARASRSAFLFSPPYSCFASIYVLNPISRSTRATDFYLCVSAIFDCIREIIYRDRERNSFFSLPPTVTAP